jgi:VWFA-related protein
MWWSITLTLWLVLVAGAQEPAVIRTSTRLVQINVVVHDKNGRVANLTKDDFVLTEQGKPRPIGVFAKEAQRRGGVEVHLPENVFSNRAGANRSGSVTIVLLDSLNTMFSDNDAYSSSISTAEDGALAYAKNQALKFARNLDPDERVAVYSLGRSLKVLCDFTGDRAQLLRVLNGYRDTSITSQDVADPGEFHSPASPEFDESVTRDKQSLAAVANAGRADTTLAALRAIAEHVADIPGRKNLVWLTANLPLNGVAAARVLRDKNIALYPVDARGLQYAHARGIPVLQDLADQTGGRAFYNTNDLSGAIHAAVEDANVSYMLGFYPDATALDGQFHELKVRVKRAGLDVRYPKGYFATRDVAPMEKKTEFLRAIQSPLEASAIGVEAKVIRMKEPAPELLRLWCSIDARGLVWEEVGDKHKAAVEVYTVQQDRTGGLLEKKRRRVDLSATREQYLEYLKAGVVFGENVQPREGMAALRVIVGDPHSAATGTLIIPASRIH